MKAHTDQLLSIEEIANGALFDLGESSHRKEQFLKWSIDYFRRYRMDIAREVRKTFLDMTPWKSILLPKDCVDWIELGIKNGEIIDTITNTKVLATRDCACDEEEPVDAVYEDELPSDIISDPWWNVGTGQMGGLIVKDNGLGNFTPNPEQRVNEIQLSAKVPTGTPIYLMYLSTLFDPSNNNVVHPYCQDLIAYGVHYENLKHKRRSGNRNIGVQDIRDAKTELDEEICKVVERRWDLRYEDIMEIIRSGHRTSPKQ